MIAIDLFQAPNLFQATNAPGLRTGDRGCAISRNISAEHPYGIGAGCPITGCPIIGCPITGRPPNKVAQLRIAGRALARIK